MYFTMMVINPRYDAKHIEHCKQIALYQLLQNISARLLDNTCMVTITSKLAPSNIYPGMQEYTLTATINEVV